MKKSLINMGLLIKSLVFVGIIIGLGVFMAWMAGTFNETISPDKKTDLHRLNIDLDKVTLAAVRDVEKQRFEQATGSLRPMEETILSSRITARILSISVREGDEVTTGQPLIELDRRDLEARLAQIDEQIISAKATLDQATLDYERTKSLLENKVTPKAELDRAEARLSTTRAALDQAKRARQEAETQLSFATITSPMAGRVTDRFTDPANTATPGAPLLRLYNPASLRLEANVRESLAMELKENARLHARIDAAGLEFDTTVQEIVPRANSASRTVLVKVSVPDDRRLFPGMFGRLYLPVGKEKKLFIPPQALNRLGQLEFVKVKTDQGAERRFVRTGREDPKWGLEVISGLDRGEQVVIE